METREQEQLNSNSVDVLRNPLLAFIGQRYYAPPAPGQVPGVAWQADTEGRALWLPRLAERLHLEMPNLRAALYDVAFRSDEYRWNIVNCIVRGAGVADSETVSVLFARYSEYCAAADWARVLANRHVLVVDGVALYDSYALHVTLNWFSRIGWKYRLLNDRLATTQWNRRSYTTEAALRCWLSGRPCPPVPNLREAVHAAGSAGKLAPRTAPRLSGAFGRTWVEFQGERYIWGQEVVRLYHVSARAQRRARHEGRLEGGVVYGCVLISFESLRPFLRWWYAHGCTWRGQANVHEAHDGHQEDGTTS